ncbi:hypothetical protein L6R52_20770 [Myxococcota bacterium]|nr:hypothetical protein [Myxococcota bacterium]
MAIVFRSVAALALVIAVAPSASAAEPEKKPTPDAKDASSADASKKGGNVLTFYGLRKLEEDPAVTDEEKLREWQAFIDRATEQVGYAKKAVDRWKNASRLRMIDTAKVSDRDPNVPPREKIRLWKEISRLFPKDPDAKTAERRAKFWKAEETKRLVAEAEEVEKARRGKVERIQAWMRVLDWIEEGPEAKAANKRIEGLQQQLFAEAENIDVIARVDDKTKLSAWRDVLAGRPSPKQQKKAERRVAELEAQLPKEQ